MAELQHFLPLEVLQDIDVFVLRTDNVTRDTIVWSSSPFDSFSVKDVYVAVSSLLGVVSDKIWSQIW